MKCVFSLVTMSDAYDFMHKLHTTSGATSDEEVVQGGKP